MKYLTTEQILFIHYRLIKETGGSHGVRDLSLLKSAQAWPMSTFGGKDLHPNIFTKTAALMHSLIKNHPFIDGNKRTAITSSFLFLLCNNYKLKVSNEELEKFTLKIAVEKTEIKIISDWFKKYSAKIIK